MTSSVPSPGAPTPPDGGRRLVQRRGSKVAHIARPRQHWATPMAECGQYLDGHMSWTVQPGELPLCKKCDRIQREPSR